MNLEEGTPQGGKDTDIRWMHKDYDAVENNLKPVNNLDLESVPKQREILPAELREIKDTCIILENLGDPSFQKDYKNRTLDEVSLLFTELSDIDKEKVDWRKAKGKAD